MGDSPDAAAPAAASAKAEATLRVRAAAALAGSGSPSGARAVGAALHIDVEKWARQVEAEFAPVHARLDETFAEISATTCCPREVAAVCADQVANSDIILCQFVKNNSCRVASRDYGDAQERQR